MNHHPKCAFALGLILALVVSLWIPSGAAGDDSKAFEGAKSTWHDGFDRYDYLMDEETLEIRPFEHRRTRNSGSRIRRGASGGAL